MSAKADGATFVPAVSTVAPLPAKVAIRNRDAPRKLIDSIANCELKSPMPCKIEQTAAMLGAPSSLVVRVATYMGRLSPAEAG